MFASELKTMHKMTRHDSAVERGLYLRTLAISDSALHAGIFVAMNVGNLSSHQSVPSHKFVIPFLQALPKDKACLCPRGLVRAGSQEIAYGPYALIFTHLY